METISNLSMFNHTCDDQWNYKAMSSEDKLRLIMFAASFLQGVVMMVANFLILAAILCYKTMRNKKEYVSVCAVALADGIQGIALLSSSVHRIGLVLSGGHMINVSARHCLASPSIILFLVVPMSGYMLFLVSLDRLIAIARPLQYFSYTVRYAWHLAAPFYVLSFGTFVFLVVYGYKLPDSNDAKWPALCSATAALGGRGFGVQYLVLSRIAGAIGSVLIYISIPFVNYCHQRKIMHHWIGANDNHNTHNGNNQLNLDNNQHDNNSGHPKQMSLNQQHLYEKHTRTQRRLTLTLGLSALATLLFLIIPSFVMSWAVSDRAGLSTEARTIIGPVALVIINCNSMINIVFYMTRHSDIRRAISSVVQCKVHFTEAVTTGSHNAAANHHSSHAIAWS